MADILSQEEVDLLLNAVSKGEVEPEPQPFETVRTRDMLTYDFRRPDRVSTEQLKGLQSLFENFARQLSIVLPPFLRTVVRVDLLSLDPLTYDEFILSVSRPTTLCEINMSPLDGNAVIELSPSIVFPVVDRILGGKGQMLGETRPLTEIEERIIHRIVLMMLDCWRSSWEHLIEFKMSIRALESDPLMVQVVPGSDMVILVGYEMHVGEAVGQMNMCIPVVFLNPVLDQITRQSQFIRKRSARVAEQTRKTIMHTLLKALVPVDAVLGTARMDVDDVANLEVDDIIQLDWDATEAIKVEVGAIERFRARPGRSGGQSAIQLASIVRED